MLTLPLPNIIVAQFRRAKASNQNILDWILAPAS